jgi:type 1 glutamine amidotransferase
MKPAVFVLAAVAIAAASPGLQSQPPAGARVLYVTHSAGFKHDVVPESETVLADLGRRHGFAVTIERDASRITAERLKPYGAVVFYTTGELPMSEQQKADFMTWLKSGRGFVGVHSATDTFYKWPEYGRMIGGYFDEHPWHEEVTLEVEDRTFPATRHLEPTWTLTDEIYQFRNYFRANTHVLLSLDTASVDLRKKGVKRTDGDFAMAWHHPWGQGRVFYTALGHRSEVWQSDAFQKHLVGGLQWALGSS